MAFRDKPVLSAEEALAIHEDAIVIDTQQPPITSGIISTPGMQAAVEELHQLGRTQMEAGPILEAILARDIATNEAARQQYLDMWKDAGVTVACGTYSGTPKMSQSFESAFRKIANAHSIVNSLRDNMLIVHEADDIERAHSEGKRGIIIDFQNTTPLGDDIDRIGYFHGLGLRMVQLTYNLRNLVGDGCTEAHKSGLTYFGREVVQRLNEYDIIVDVSHCTEQVGWDTMDVSSAPVIVSHSSSASVAQHDRGKTDEFAKAIANQGGYFGVVTLPGFIRETPGCTIDDVVKQIEYLVNICGIDHVGIGTDKAGPGPGTSSMVQYPEGMRPGLPTDFNWGGFRSPEHRITNEYQIEGFNKFSDWPNITTGLAAAGFNEEELRKLLGLNYLRVFRDIVG